MNSKGSLKGHKKGAQSKDSSRRRKRQALEEAPDPRVSPIVKLFYETYSRTLGKPPTQTAFNPPRAAKEIKALPAAYTLEDLTRAVQLYFHPETPSWIRGNNSWSRFLQEIPRLLKTDWAQARPGRAGRRVLVGANAPGHWDDWLTEGNHGE